MTDPKKFFLDNINNHTSAQTSPQAFNLNCGLLHLTERIEAMEGQMHELQRLISLLLQQRH